MGKPLEIDIEKSWKPLGSFKRTGWSRRVELRIGWFECEPIDIICDDGLGLRETVMWDGDGNQKLKNWGRVAVKSYSTYSYTTTYTNTTQTTM